MDDSNSARLAIAGLLAYYPQCSKDRQCGAALVVRRDFEPAVQCGSAASCFGDDLLGRRSAPRVTATTALVGPDGCGRRVGLGRLQADGRRDAGFRVGTLLLLRAEVGPFDKRFCLHAEEEGRPRPPRRAGWEVTCRPNLLALHQLAGTGCGTISDPVLREALFHCGTKTYAHTWHGALGWQSYRATAVVAARLRSARPPPGARRHTLVLAALHARGPCYRLTTMPPAVPFNGRG